MSGHLGHGAHAGLIHQVLAVRVLVGHLDQDAFVASHWLLVADVECVNTVLEVHFVLGLHLLLFSLDLLLHILVGLLLEEGVDLA